MRRLFSARYLFLAALIAWATTSPIKAAPEIRSLRNAQFETVGFHLRSVSYINELSLFAVQIAERYLEREGLDFPLPILVSLRPLEHATFEEDYRIRIEERGAVELDIRWEASLSLEQTCRALVEALVVQYLVFNRGVDSVGEIKAWPVEALSTEVYLGLRPAMFVKQVGDARETPRPLLSDVMQTKLADAERESIFGFWLMQVVNSAGVLDRTASRGLFQAAIAGSDVEQNLVSKIESSEPPEESFTTQEWWSDQLELLLARDYEAVETMQASRTWLEPLIQFSEPIKLESGEVELNLRSLWTHRENPDVRMLIQARYEILRMRISRVNPAYFNAAHSIGLLYEALLGESAYHVYVHSLAIFLSDWENMKDMQARLETYFENNL